MRPSDGVSTTFSFKHDAQDRFYGNGNESENHAGPLVHTSGKQVINNGTTCLPFIWSPSGFGILIANDIHDVNSHITWLDHDGTLTWTVPEAFADIYLMAAADGAGVLGDYARLTGSAPIPPRWTFGLLLSRRGYKDAADVRTSGGNFGIAKYQSMLSSTTTIGTKATGISTPPCSPTRGTTSRKCTR